MLDRTSCVVKMVCLHPEPALLEVNPQRAPSLR